MLPIVPYLVGTRSFRPRQPLLITAWQRVSSFLPERWAIFGRSRKRRRCMALKGQIPDPPHGHKPRPDKNIIEKMTRIPRNSARLLSPLMMTLFLFAALEPAQGAKPGPGLEFLAGVGPSGSEVGDVAVGPDGSVYIVGAGPGPESTGGQWRFDEWDVFVAKLSPDGQTLQYLKFIGGSRYERAAALQVDASGAVYVAGLTSSSDFPVLGGGYRAPTACGEWPQKGVCLKVFVAKLDPSGSKIIYSALLGGSALDMATGLAIDQAGAAYVTGVTMSSDFPVTPFALQKSHHSAPYAMDGFVAKIDPDGHGLAFSTYLGGNGNDEPLGVAVDSSGQPLIAMTSEGFTVLGGVDVTGKTYVARIGSLGEYASVVAQTGLRTQTGTLGSRFALDNRGSAYVLGESVGEECAGHRGDYIWKAPLDGAQDGYVRCFDFRVTGLAIDRDGEPLIAGSVWEDFAPQVTPDALQTCVNGDRDAILVRLDAAGEIAFSTFLGGSGSEEFAVVATGPGNAAYVAATTVSLDFPPPDGAESRHGIAVAKIGFDARPSTWIQCAANGASWKARAIGPGEVLSVTGWGLGPPEPAGLKLDSSGKVTSELGGTRLLFDGVAAPLLYAGERSSRSGARSSWRRSIRASSPSKPRAAARQPPSTRTGR